MAEKSTAEHSNFSYKTLSERGWFKDRRELIETYFASLNNIQGASLQLLIYYGLGGQGKTALCKEVIKRTKETNDKDVIVGHLDLHERSQLSGEGALLWVRNALAQNANLKFPAFDLGFTMYWKTTRPEQPLPYFIRHGWLSAASDFGEDLGVEFIDDILSDLAKAITDGLIESVPLAVLARKLFGLGRKQAARQLLVRSNADVRELVQCKGELSAANLYSRLPILLGNDLRRSIEENTRRRFVLLIDEYERVFEEGGASSSLVSSSFDDAIRLLISRLTKTLVVIFSRERLPWAKHPPVGENAAVWSKWIEESHCPVDGLRKEDAREILKDAGIENMALIAAIIDGAQIIDDSEPLIYPLMLELQIHHYEAIKNAGREPISDDFRTAEASYESLLRLLVERFIRDYGLQTQIMIRVLAVPRFFNREVFDALRTILPGGGSLEQFNVISTLAFVQKQDNEHLTFPKAIREALLLLTDDAVKLEAHRTLWQFYRQRAEEASPQNAESVGPALEAIYHGLALDTSETLAWWRDLANKYQEAGRLILSAPIAELVISTLESLQPAFRPELAQALSELTSSYRFLGRPRAAIRLQSRSLALRRQMISHDSLALIDPLLALADLYRSEDNFIEAEILTDEALDVAENHSRNSPSLEKTNALTIAAQTLEERGRFDSAEPLRRSVLAITKQVLSYNAPFHLQALVSLMSNLVVQNRIDDARSVGRELIEAVERDEERPVIALMLFFRGATFWATRSEDSFFKEYVEHGIRLFEARYGLSATADANSGFAQGRIAFAFLVQYVRRTEESLRLGDLAVEQMRANSQWAKPALTEVLVNCSVLNASAGEVEKAQSLLSEAEALLPQLTETPHDLLVLLAQARNILASRVQSLKGEDPYDVNLRETAALTLEEADPAQRWQLMRVSLSEVDQQYGSNSREACMERVGWAGGFLTLGQPLEALSASREAIEIIEKQAANGNDWAQEAIIANIVHCSALTANDEFEELGQRLEWLNSNLSDEAIASNQLIPVVRLQLAEQRVVKARPGDAHKEVEEYISLLKTYRQFVLNVDQLIDVLVIIGRHSRGEDLELSEIERVLTAVEHVPIQQLLRIKLKDLVSEKNAQAGNYERAIQLKQAVVNSLFITKGGLDLTLRITLIELAELCKLAGRYGEAHKWRKKALRDFAPNSPEEAVFWAQEAASLAAEFLRQRSPNAAHQLLEQVLATPETLLPALSPHRWDVRRRLIESLIELKQFSAAQQSVEDLSRDMSASAFANPSWKSIVEHIAAEVALMKGNLAEALVHSNNALALMPNLSPESTWLRSETLLNSLKVSVAIDHNALTPEKIEEIIAEYKSFHEHPAFVRLLTDIALLELRAKQPGMAAAHLERAINLSAVTWGRDNASHLFLQDLLANIKENPADPERAVQTRYERRLQNATKHLRLSSPSEWPLPTSLRDDWTYLAQDQLIEFVAAVISYQEQDGQVVLPERFKVLAARRLSLPFYRETFLIEVLVEDTAGNIGYFGLTQQQNRLTLLSGPSTQIFNLNLTTHLPGELDWNLQLSYLRFFCSWIMSDEGPFLLVERAADAPPILPGNEAKVLEVFKQIENIHLSARFGEKRKGKIFGAWVIYAGVPFRAWFEIQPNNAVLMLEDEPMSETPLFMSWRLRDGARFLTVGAST